MDATQERRSVEAITQKKAPTYSAVCPAAKPTGMKPAAVVSVPASIGFAHPLYAACAAGADGLEIEVHDRPSEAWSDGAQALTPPQFADAMRRIALIREAISADVGA